MSGIPRGAASTADNPRWYLEVSGRRAGPFAWAVIIELAQAGALHPDDRIWRMGLASWSRADSLPDLAPLIREPALSERVLAPRPLARRAIGAWAALCALVVLAAVIGATFHHRHFSAIAVDRVVHRVLADGVGRSAESLSSLSRQVSAFEANYPFLTDLRRVDAPRFDELDRAIRLGFRRGAAAGELNGYVADAAGEIERQRLANVGDSNALRFAMALRAAARTFRSADPAQCAAILEPVSAASAVRSAGALAAIAPALSALLDAPMTQRATELTPRKPPSADPDTADAGPRMNCDRLLFMYDGAAAQAPDIAAAFVRAMQGTGGS